MDSVSRRRFLGGAAALPAVSYARIIGANDRIQIGLLGCGHRSSGHRAHAQEVAPRPIPNFESRSVCDLWSVNRDEAADDVQRLFGKRPKTFQVFRRDAGRSGSRRGDDRHRRSPACADSGRSGARGQGLLLREAHGEHAGQTPNWRATRSRRAKQVVQMGSQWLSYPYQQQVREIVRSGKLGKIVSISQSWNFNGPRWHVPKSADIAAIREQDTDWNRWLLGRARAAVRSARVFRVPHFQGFFRRHHGPVV